MGTQLVSFVTNDVLSSGRTATCTIGSDNIASQRRSRLQRSSIG
jgi:hypothetical protein